jgi:hypothetical protein
MCARLLAATCAAFGCALVLMGCAEEPAAQSIAGSDPTITVREGRCVLKIRSQEVVLQPAPPCFFVYDQRGRIQVHDRRDAAKTTLVLVGGTPANPDPDPVPAGAGPCGTEVQAVALTADKVQPLTRLGRGSRICARQGGVDEKYFEIFDR